MKDILLVPQPAHLQWHAGEYAPGSPLPLCLPDALSGLQGALPQFLRAQIELSANAADIFFIMLDSLPREGYNLTVSAQGVQIKYSHAQGAFYALVTLGQLLSQCDSIPFCTIKDAPGLSIRGFMLDISRGKVPKLETLFEIADLMASFKMNHLQLYIEGFSFAYPSFPDFWEAESSISGEEIRQLDRYCRERFIDLVPNQNCLGHMAAWLGAKRFRHLAEKEEGLSVQGMQFPPTTLNPLDAGSVSLIKTMSADLLSNFTSSYFNFNLDEPFELGKGKNSKAAREQGVGRLYLDYAKKMHGIAHAHGKRMMMWGDVVAKHSEILLELPKDILLLEWGYEAEHPFEKRSQTLSAAGLQFCLCLGTSSWNSFTGLADNMLQNIANAAKCAYAYEAQGIILTDWGDSGHLQYLPVSFAPMVYSAALSWNREGIAEPELAAALDRFVFMDKASVMGQFSLDAGRYCQFEAFSAPCRSLATFPLMLGYMQKDRYMAVVEKIMNAFFLMMPEETAEIYHKKYDERKEPDYASLFSYLDALGERLAKQQMRCFHHEQIAWEYRNSLQMVRTLEAIAGLMFIKEPGRGIHETVSEIRDAIARISKEHRSLWLYRNKAGGVEQSLLGFQRLANQLSGHKRHDR